MKAHIDIPLPCGKVAIISAEDAGRVLALKWSDRGDGYVRARWSKKAGGDGSVVFLHRFVLAPPKGMVVDHIDGDPLNNTRDNLQIISQSRNCMKSRTAIKGGVTAHRGKWRARMRVDGEMHSLGVYQDRDYAQAVVDAYRALMWQTGATVSRAAP
jgi:hypothetical protein